MDDAERFVLCQIGGELEGPLGITTAVEDYMRAEIDARNRDVLGDELA